MDAERIAEFKGAIQADDLPVWKYQACIRECLDEIDRLGDVSDAEADRLVGADQLAYAVAQAIDRRSILTRTAVSDAMETYLGIGCMDGPATVPDWVKQYEAAEAGGDS